MKLSKFDYYLPAGYQVNIEPITLDTSERKYWTKKRIKHASLYQWHVYRWVKQIVSKTGSQSLIDIGCGPAVKLNLFFGKTGVDYVGIDQRSAIDYCKNNYTNGEYIVDDFSNPNFKPNVKPEVLVCSDVIEHLVNPDILIDYIKSLSDKNTLIFISTPDRSFHWGQNCMGSPNPSHIREWAQIELIQYLHDRGLTVHEVRYFPPLKLSLNLISIIHFFKQLKPGRKLLYNMAFLCSVTHSDEQ